MIDFPHFFIHAAALSVITIIRPETVVRWHRTGFRLHWRWKSRFQGGRPRMPGEIRRLIRDMSLANGERG